MSLIGPETLGGILHASVQREVRRIRDGIHVLELSLHVLRRDPLHLLLEGLVIGFDDLYRCFGNLPIKTQGSEANQGISLWDIWEMKEQACMPTEYMQDALQTCPARETNSSLPKQPPRKHIRSVDTLKATAVVKLHTASHQRHVNETIALVASFKTEKKSCRAGHCQVVETTTANTKTETCAPNSISSLNRRCRSSFVEHETCMLPLSRKSFLLFLATNFLIDMFSELRDIHLR